MNWTAESDRRLREMRREGLSHSAIGHMLGCSRQAVMRRATKLNAPDPEKVWYRLPRWSENQLARLRNMWGKESVAAMASALGRSAGAVNLKAHDLGLTSTSDRGASGAKAVAVAKEITLKRWPGNTHQVPADSPGATHCYWRALLELNERRLADCLHRQGPWSEMEDADLAAELAMLRGAAEVVRRKMGASGG